MKETFRRWRWVTRDTDSRFVQIWADEARPVVYIPHVGCGGGHEWRLPVLGRLGFTTVCADDFADLTGFTIPTDRPVKVEFSAEIVE